MGQQGKAERAAALAAEAPYRMDTCGKPIVAGDAVMCYALQSKEKYDKRKANVGRSNARAAVVLMLEGPAQGEKRKVDYKVIEVGALNKQTIRGRRFLGALVADGGQPIGAGQNAPPCSAAWR